MKWQFGFPSVRTMSSKQRHPLRTRWVSWPATDMKMLPRKPGIFWALHALDLCELKPNHPNFEKSNYISETLSLLQVFRISLDSCVLPQVASCCFEWLPKGPVEQDRTQVLTSTMWAQYQHTAPITTAKSRALWIRWRQTPPPRLGPVSYYVLGTPCLSRGIDHSTYRKCVPFWFSCQLNSKETMNAR